MSTATSVDVPELGQQLGLIQSLNSVLDEFQNVNRSTLQSIQSQAAVFQQVADIYLNFENTSMQMMQNFSELHRVLNDISQKKISTKINSTSTKELEKVCDKAESASSKIASDISDDANKMTSQVNASKRQIDASNTANIRNNIDRKKENKFIDLAAIKAKLIDKHINKFKDNIDDIVSDASSASSLSGSAPNPWIIGAKIAWIILKTSAKIVYNLFSSAISFLTDFVKLTITLPFMLASFANKIGSAFRKKIDEELGNAIESFKENISFDSYTGKNINNLGKQVKSSLSDFTILNNRITKIFGYEGEQKVLEEAKNIISGIGMFSEVFSKNLSSIDNILYLKEAQNYLGIGIQELNYYALNAYVNVEKINEQLHKAMIAISKTSKKFNIDSKSISSLYHKLRLNIEDFGHFSEFELSEMSAKLIKLRVKTEDVTGIFSKISTFESAADLSTKLFQSFGALIDAYDLLTAEDPAQMIKMLRDGMFKTGKQFSSLNRHEKQLMQQVTGLSVETLNSVMNFNDMSMSQEEIRQKLNSEDPIGLQLKTTKELVNSIKTLKKVLDFSSPFDAIFKGIMGNIAYQKNTIKITQGYSELLQNINQSIRKIDVKLIQKVTTPIILMLEKFQKYIFDGRFIKLIKNGLTIISDFIQGIFTISTKTITDDIILKYKTWYNKQSNDDKSKYQNEMIKNLQYAYKDKDNPLNSLVKDLLKKRILIKDKKGNITLGNNTSFESLLSNLTSIASKDHATGINIIENLIAKGKQKNQLINIGSIDLQQTILNNIISSLNEMLIEGSPLFKGIYNIGREIISAMIRFFVIGLTSFMNIISGKIDNALRDNSNKGFSLESFSNISIEEFKKLSENIAEQIGRSIVIVVPVVINIAWKAIQESMTIIYTTFKQIFIKSAAFLYNFVYNNAPFYYKPIIWYKTPKEVIRQAEIIDAQQIENPTERKNKLYEILTNYEQLKTRHMLDSIKKINEINKEDITLNPNLNKARYSNDTLEELSEKIMKGEKLNKRMINQEFYELAEKLAYYNLKIKEINELISEAKVEKLKKIDDGSISSLIRIDDKDSIELIASKDTGLLITSYDMIKEKYDQVINNINLKLQNNKFNNDIDINYENELLCLIDEIGNFIDNNYNKNNIDNIKIDKLHIIT